MNPMGATIRSAKWLPLCHSRTFCFFKQANALLCQARAGTAVPDCSLSHTHLWAYTNRHTHTYRTHTSPRWLINSLHSKLNSTLHLRSQISAPFLFSFPTLKITFIKVITLLLPELQINERRAVSSTAPLWECYLFLSEKKRNTDIILVAANYVNQSPELIWSIQTEEIPAEPLVFLWPV